MKKIGLGILIVGIILVITPILFPNLLTKEPNGEEVNNNDDNNNIDINTKIKWSTLYGNPINVNYDEYNENDLTNDYFFSIDGSNNKYSFALPKTNYLYKVAHFSDYYAGNVVVKYGDNNIDDIDQYANQYVELYKNIYNKIYIQKYVINDKKIAIFFKALNTSNNSYIEELELLYKNNKNNYSSVEYEIQNKIFNEDFIIKLIDNYKLKEEKANYNTCVKVNNNNVCTIFISSINETIEFNVNTNKYSFSNSLSYNNHQLNFSNIVTDDNDEKLVDERINISFILTDNLVNSLNDNAELKLSNANILEINGKSVKKYDLSRDKEYRAFYVVAINDKLALFFDVNSNTNNTDTIIYDFMNYNMGKK